MRALTMDEVECVGGGAVMEDIREEVAVTGRRTSDWWNPSTYLLNSGGAFGTAGQNSGGYRYYSAAADAAGYYIDDYTGDYATMRDYKLALESGHPKNSDGSAKNAGILNSLINAVANFFAGPHQYNAVSTLTLCTTSQSMQALMSPWMSAPGAPQAQEGLDRPVTLLFGNPILQTVNINAATISNVALPNHIFQGQVTTQVSAAYGGSQITTYGTGVAGVNIAIGALNTAIGHLYFGGRNIAVSMECDAINGVYVP
jgi:hypothetical protein